MMIRLAVLLLSMIGLGGCAATTGARRAMPAVGASFVDCRGCPRMVVVPAGSFRIGSPPGEAHRDADEGPQKTIVIARPFAVGFVPVTRAQYARFARDTHQPPADICYADRGHSGRWGIQSGTSWRDPGFAQTDRDPVVCVNFDEMRAYLAWLNRRAGGGYRLMSQAEHEYAERAGATTAFPWGEAITHDQANFGADPCCHPLAEGRDRWLATSPGGAFPANAFGLADMQGNVWELVEDCYDPALALLPDDGLPYLGGRCEKRVLRGAAWDDPPYYLRSANRYQQLETLRGAATGFRVAKTLPAPPVTRP